VPAGVEGGVEIGDSMPHAALEHPQPDAQGMSGRIAPHPMAQAPSVAPHALVLLDRAGEIRPLDEVESEVIRFAIAHYRGQMSEVARRLQIGRSTLYRKLDSLGLGTGEEAPSDPEGVVAG
jgi:DNA-binding NtrC family response regulator